MRIDQPADHGLAGQARPTLQDRRHTLRRAAPRRDLHLPVETAENSLDALARGAEQPADAVVGDAETQVDQDREFQVTQLPRRRVLQLLGEHIGERHPVHEHLLHGILHEPLRNGALVQEAPHRRAPPVLRRHQLLDLVEISGIPGMDRPEHDAAGDARARRPRLEDLPRDGGARIPLSAEVEIEHEILDPLLGGDPDRLVRRGGAEHLRRRPALPDPRRHLRDGVRRVVGDQDPQRRVGLPASSRHAPPPCPLITRPRRRARRPRRDRPRAWFRCRAA